MNKAHKGESQTKKQNQWCQFWVHVAEIRVSKKKIQNYFLMSLEQIYRIMYMESTQSTLNQFYCSRLIYFVWILRTREITWLLPSATQLISLAYLACRFLAEGSTVTSVFRRYLCPPMIAFPKYCLGSTSSTLYLNEALSFFDKCVSRSQKLAFKNVQSFIVKQANSVVALYILR